MNEYIDKRVKRSKSALKETLLELLMDKDIDDITISEIVKNANYNRGTFYSHFASKERLLDEIIQETLTEMILHIREPYANRDKVNMREMKAENISLFHYFLEQKDLFIALLNENIHIDFRYKLAKALEELFLSEYQYEFTEKNNLEPKWLYVYRAHGVAAVIIRWIEDGFQQSPDYMAEQIIALMITGTEIFYVKGRVI